MKKLTYEFVKEQFEKEGYTLLSTEYINSKTKLEYICPEGHKRKINWNEFNSGRRCKICFYKRNKFSYEFVKEQFKKEGYTLLSTKYIDNSKKLKYICPNGHERETKFSSFRSGGRRCLICVNENKKGKDNPNWKGGVTKLDISLFDTYASKISWCEDVRRDPENKNYLQVRCTKCKKWFNPRTKDVQHRINAIYDTIGGRHFYCSDKCKKECCFFGQQIYPKKFNVYKKYKATVKYLSNINFIKYFYIINPNKLKRAYEAYHLDHIYSISDGFKNNIPERIIANPYNLQMLWWKDNIAKGDKSDITIKKLYLLYFKYLCELHIKTRRKDDNL